MSDKKPSYEKYLTKTTYEKYEKCTIIKKYKIIESSDIRKVAHVTIKKDKNGKKIYNVKYEED
jgi:hypothetical protein